MRRLLTALTAVLLLVGCAAAPPENQDEATLRVVTPYRVRSLDPIKQGLWSPEWGYGELLMRATEDGGVQPWLLERLEPVSPTEWRLVLRAGVTFANGRVLDSAALKAVFDRHLADNALARGALPGAGATVVDARTLRLTTASPVGNLPNLLADEQMISVFDAEAVASAGQDPTALVGKGIYTGPFVVSKLDENELVLSRNPRYWGGQPALAGATVRFVPDGQARVLAVRNGEADLALYPPTEALGPLRDATSGPRMATARQPLQQLRAISNLRRAPMNERAVRLAFALAIDYDQLARQVLDGVYRTPTGIYPDVVGFAEPTQRTDADRARRLLDEAGWLPGPEGVRARGGTPLRITMLTYPQQPDTRSVAVALQAQLARVGFAVEVSEVQNNYEAMRKADGWDVGLSFDGTLGYTFDPVGPLRDFLTSGGAKNFGGVADPRLDELVAALTGMTDSGARDPVLRRLQRVIADDGYLVVVAQRATAAVVGGAFTGYRPSSVLHHLNAHTRAS